LLALPNVAAFRAANEMLQLFAWCYTVFRLSGILRAENSSSLPDAMSGFFLRGNMSNVKAILEALQSGPATSTELADKTGMDRSSAKVACLALLKKQLVKREMTDRVGKGPKTAYRYELISAS
jgi:hypothetical protein